MYAAGMEMLYQKMWERYSRGEKPDHLAAIEKADNQGDATLA
jgi:protein O-GlcNAc transferase